MEERKNFLLYFCYTTGWIALPATAGATASATISILADANFMTKYMTIGVRQANVLVVNWAGDIQINDSGVGRDWYNAFSPVQAFAGSGSLPYPFNPPRVTARNSSLVVTVRNNVATATDVNVVLHGSKVYRTQAEMETGVHA